MVPFLRNGIQQEPFAVWRDRVLLEILGLNGAAKVCRKQSYRRTGFRHLPGCTEPKGHFH
jgi:hypothetical protein